MSGKRGPTQHDAAAIDLPPPIRRSTSTVVAGLTAVNLLIMVAGLITGPLMARALGPDGRGAFAAVTVPLTFTAVLLAFGLPIYATQKAAVDDVPPRTLMLTLCALLIPSALLSVVVAPPLAAFLSDGREEVRLPLLIGFLLMPVSLIGQILIGIANGRQQWGRLALSKAIPALLGLVGTVLLYIFGVLTVLSASALLIGGGILAILPAVAPLRRGGPLRVDLGTTQRALRFGPAAWLWQLGSLTNARLDQMLMVSLTSPRQLGLYAVAVTMAGVSTIFLAALGPALLPRVAAGAHDSVPRACRASMLATAVGAGTVAVIAPVAVPLLFGPDFGPAVPMLEILLIGMLPGTGIVVLSSALLAAERPRWVAGAEAAAVIVTVPGLILVLTHYGGIGASLVSLCAYSITLCILVVGASRRFGFRASHFLVPRRADAAYLIAIAREGGRRLRLWVDATRIGR